MVCALFVLEGSQYGMIRAKMFAVVVCFVLKGSQALMKNGEDRGRRQPVRESKRGGGPTRGGLRIFPLFPPYGLC